MKPQFAAVFERIFRLNEGVFVGMKPVVKARQ